MDVVALVQFGIENVVATLGTATTKTHLDRLFRHCPEVVFCFDGDRAGRAAAWRALEVGLSALRDGRQIGFLFLPEGQDPDTLVRAEGTEAFGRRMQDAVPLPDFMLQNLTEQVDLSRMDGRARLASLAKPLLGRLEGGVLRELLMERLARLCELPRESLEKQLRGEPAAPERRTVPPGATGTERSTERGALRTALALAMQQPQLARIVGDLTDLHTLHRVGAEVLAELVELVRHHPGLSTGALLERFRDRDYLPRLEKLAAWDHLIPEEKIEDEFRAAVGRLHRAAREHEARELLAESRRRDLSEEEKGRLRRLLNRETGPAGT
jgi:DNA primase